MHALVNSVQFTTVCASSIPRNRLKTSKVFLERSVEAKAHRRGSERWAKKPTGRRLRIVTELPLKLWGRPEVRRRREG